MAPFQILPAERGFYDWFEKGAATARDAARLLANLLNDYRDAEGRVLQITELEHQGDFIVHETLNLLSRTFITPLEGDEIRALVSAVDDVTDWIEDAADALLLYDIERADPRSPDSRHAAAPGHRADGRGDADAPGEEEPAPDQGLHRRDQPPGERGRPHPPRRAGPAGPRARRLVRVPCAGRRSSRRSRRPPTSARTWRTSWRRWPSRTPDVSCQLSVSGCRNQSPGTYLRLA